MKCNASQKEQQARCFFNEKKKIKEVFSSEILTISTFNEMS
jgi:hypothetical protein